MGFRTYLWDRRRSWLLALGLLAVLLVVLLLFRLLFLCLLSEKIQGHNGDDQNGQNDQ